MAALVVPQVLVLLVQGAAPLLLREAPLLLLALHPYEPWSVLVAARSDVLPFVAIVVAVRAVPACGGYLVGRWYGPAALDRLTRTRAGRWAGWPRLATGRTSAVLLVLYPGATASLLAGVGRLRARVFLPLMLTGLVLGAVVSRVLAGVAAGPVDAVSGFVVRHVAVLSAVLLAVAVAAGLRRRRPLRWGRAPDPRRDRWRRDRGPEVLPRRPWPDEGGVARSPAAFPASATSALDPEENAP